MRGVVVLESGGDVSARGADGVRLCRRMARWVLGAVSMSRYGEGCLQEGGKVGWFYKDLVVEGWWTGMEFGNRWSDPNILCLLEVGTVEKVKMMNDHDHV